LTKVNDEKKVDCLFSPEQIDYIDRRIEEKLKPEIEMNDILRKEIKVNRLTIMASQATIKQLIGKFKEQLNVFDRNKIGYNFVFMFASPSYIPVRSSAGEK
jgi:hypothetical protein